VSLEDDLMRLFGSDRVAGIMSRLGLEEGQELEHKWLNRSIETAQKRVEQQNYSIRKRTLEYDDVMNKQREVVYGFRGEVVGSDNVRAHIFDIFDDVISSEAEMIDAAEDDGLRQFVEWVQATFPVAVNLAELKGSSGDPALLSKAVFERVKKAYELKVSLEDQGSVATMERHIVLQCIDSQWQEYLRGMDALRQGVGLRAYGQRDPLVEYKREAYQMFEELMGSIKQDVVSAVFRSSTSVDSFETFLSQLPQTLVHDEVSVLGQGADRLAGRPSGAGVDPAAVGMGPETTPGGAPVRRESPKVGRNDPCPCGSGKKYKKCCGG